MVGRMLWTEFFSNKDWPLASALALVLLALLVVPFVALQRWQTRLGGES
jgi:putrescine transport system permease protein